MDASNVELAFQNELTGTSSTVAQLREYEHGFNILTNDAEIYRIVSSKALDQGEASNAPGPGTSVPLGPSNPPGEAKKAQCC